MTQKEYDELQNFLNELLKEEKNFEKKEDKEEYLFQIGRMKRALFFANKGKNPIEYT